MLLNQSINIEVLHAFLKNVLLSLIHRTYLPIFSAVFLGVLDADVSEPLAHGAGGLVGGQNSLARGDDRVGDVGQLLLQLGRGVVEVGGHCDEFVVPAADRETKVR